MKTLFLSILTLFLLLGVIPEVEASFLSTTHGPCRFQTMRLENLEEDLKDAREDAEDFTGSFSDCVTMWQDYYNICDEYWTKYVETWKTCNPLTFPVDKKKARRAAVQGQATYEISECALDLADAIVNQC